MTKRTREKLGQVFGYPFFQNVEKTLPNHVFRIENWATALKECSRPKWEKCRLMARNTLQRSLEERCWERIKDWNTLAAEIRPLVTSFTAHQLQEAVPKDMFEGIKPKLDWDIMGICFETEYSDLVEPLFFLPHLDPWYACGHFPCGWDGEEFPLRWDGVIRDGKLMVF